MDEDQRARIRGEKVGFVFQTFQLIPTLTAQENVQVPLELRGDAGATSRARELLERVGLAGREHHYPAQLSGGEQQRVALARGFSIRPKVLFADEPTGNLDATHRCHDHRSDGGAEPGPRHYAGAGHPRSRPCQAGQPYHPAGRRERRGRLRRVTRLGFVFRMAARELGAAPRRLLLLTGTVAVGVAALVAINSFTDNLQDSVRRQARALLGADLALVSRQAFSPRVEALLDTLSRGARLSRVTSFAGMAYVPRTAGTRLVQVAAVEGRFPFYGEIRTEPRQAWTQLQAGRHVVVDPSLLTALSARIGDTVALGEGRFVITGTIQSAPSDAGVRFAFGPRIYIPARYLEETKLLGFGARVEHEAFLELPASVSAQALADRYRSGPAPKRVRLRTVADDQRNLNDVLSKLTGYLGLVALVALLLGGIGVASAMVVFVRQRSETVAVLRCLGATAGDIFAIYLLEAGVMGLVGSVAGALLGIGLQRLLPGLLAGMLPVDVTPTLSWSAAGLGIGMGLWVALMFTLLPLLAVRRVSPLSALRRPYESERPPRDRWSILALPARWPGAPWLWRRIRSGAGGRERFSRGR